MALTSDDFEFDESSPGDDNFDALLDVLEMDYDAFWDFYMDIEYDEFPEQLSFYH